MRFAVLASLVFILAVGLLGCASRDSIVSQAQRPAGQASQSPSPAPPADNARRITAEEAHKLLEKGEFTVVATVGLVPNAVADNKPSPAALLDELGQLTDNDRMSRRAAIGALATKHHLRPNEVYELIEQAKR